MKDLSTTIYETLNRHNISNSALITADILAACIDETKSDIDSDSRILFMVIKRYIPTFTRNPNTNREEKVRIKWEHIEGKERHRDLVMFRHILHEVLNERYGCTKTSRVTKVDHSSVLHSAKTILDWVSTDKRFRAMYENIRKDLNNIQK